MNSLCSNLGRNREEDKQIEQKLERKARSGQDCGDGEYLSRRPKLRAGFQCVPEALKFSMGLAEESQFDK
jgi:hypothetical protein